VFEIIANGPNLIKPVDTLMSEETAQTKRRNAKLSVTQGLKRKQFIEGKMRVLRENFFSGSDQTKRCCKHYGRTKETESERGSRMKSRTIETEGK
jgi:hypothetical protein